MWPLDPQIASIEKKHSFFQTGLSKTVYLQMEIFVEIHVIANLIPILKNLSEKNCLIYRSVRTHLYELKICNFSEKSMLWFLSTLYLQTDIHGDFNYVSMHAITKNPFSGSDTNWNILRNWMFHSLLFENT